VIFFKDGNPAGTLLGMQTLARTEPLIEVEALG
jgi:hypothetical protein